MTVRRNASIDLGGSEVAAIRELLDAAFNSADDDEQFTEADWEHALGGVHFILEIDSVIVAHAAVVERLLHVDDLPLRTGYVEAVATAPSERGKGHGTALMRDVGAYIAERFELGALGTGSFQFYDRLGWRTWRGPSYVRTAAGLRATPDDDGYIMVLETPSSPTLDLAASISCDFRPGDVW